MTTPAQQQNAMMLASLLGIGEDEAAERLNATVLITTEDSWKALWAGELEALLRRTVTTRRTAGGAVPDVEVVVGRAMARTHARPVFVDLDEKGVTVTGVSSAKRGSGRPHGLFAAAAACAATAAVLRVALDDPGMPDVRMPLSLAFDDLGVPCDAIERPLILKDAFLAGAGAVAHGFLHAARHLDLRGELSIVDPKPVAAGVLNRCLYLQEEDVDRDKAEALASRAQPHFPALRLVPVVDDFRQVVRRPEGPPELVFTTVDSRAVRRSIQMEMPHRIVDGSTTDATGVIVHSNTLPTEQACLACIYRHVPQEDARERAIAEALGVDQAVLRNVYIDEATANQIAARYPGKVDAAEIVGLAYDTMFRRLCGQQAITTAEGRQVLAPFAFVSCWAGVLMTVELLRMAHGGYPTNYWSVDPWNGPVGRARTVRGKAENCPFCSLPGLQAAIRGQWPSSAWPVED